MTQRLGADPIDAKMPAMLLCAGKLRRSLLWSGVLALLLVALRAGCATIDEQQRRWIFQPGARTWAGAAAAEGMQDVWIEHESAALGQRVRLHGLWLPQASPQAPVLLYLHGARWDVRSSSHRMRRLHELGFSVLAIDYRGFGRSTNALPSEAQALEDALAAWHWLGAAKGLAPRFVFGHSLGGALAVQLAARVSDAKGLIVEGSFTSIPDVVSSFKWGWLPVGPFITQRFDAAAEIGRVKAPVLVVHGEADNLIPHALGRALFERAPEPKRFVLVANGSHHNTNSLGQAQYRQALQELFGLRAALQ